MVWRFLKYFGTNTDRLDRDPDMAAALAAVNGNPSGGRASPSDRLTVPRAHNNNRLLTPAA